MNAPITVEAFAGTENWFAARRGCLTGSRMADAAAVLKTGKPAAAREQLLADLCAERLTGFAVSHYVTPAMQHGIDNQAAAIAAYEAESGNLVGAEAFVLHPAIEFFGATPDGFVDDEGLVEVKCPTSSTFVRWLADGVVPEQHHLQMLAQLACTRRQWVDFVAFDPRMPGACQLFIRRFKPPASEIERVEMIAREFLDELDALFERVATGA